MRLEVLCAILAGLETSGDGVLCIGGAESDSVRLQAARSMEALFAEARDEMVRRHEERNARAARATRPGNDDKTVITTSKTEDRGSA